MLVILALRKSLKYSFGVSMNCKICTQPVSFEFNVKLLNKYQVDFFYCKSCGFLQTEKPYWLDEAYSEAIAIADTGLVARNINI